MAASVLGSQISPFWGWQNASVYCEVGGRQRPKDLLREDEEGKTGLVLL